MWEKIIWVFLVDLKISALEHYMLAARVKMLRCAIILTVNYNWQHCLVSKLTSESRLWGTRLSKQKCDLWKGTCLWQRLLAYSQCLFSSFAVSKKSAYVWGIWPPKIEATLPTFPCQIGEAEWLSSGHFTLSTRAMVKFRVRFLKRGWCHLILVSLSIAIQPWQEGPCPGPWSTPLHGVKNYRQRGRAHLEPKPFFTGHALGGQTSELPVQMATKPAQVSSPGSACKGGLCCLCAHLGPLE